MVLIIIIIIITQARRQGSYRRAATAENRKITVDRHNAPRDRFRARSPSSQRSDQQSVGGVLSFRSPRSLPCVNRAAIFPFARIIIIVITSRPTDFSTAFFVKLSRQQYDLPITTTSNHYYEKIK